jgi:hypothetical protein
MPRILRESGMHIFTFGMVLSQQRLKSRNDHAREGERSEFVIVIKIKFTSKKRSGGSQRVKLLLQ